MAIRKINPTSPGQRGMTKSDYQEITTSTPEKSLLKKIAKTAGRNNTGRITCRKTVEYDPNRNVRISLVFYADGEKRYILTPEGLNVGDVIVSGPEAAIQTGNALPLELIPLGTIVHNIELTPGRGGKMVRSAGNFAQVMAKEGNYVTIKLPSGEMRMVRKECMATIGTLGNAEFKNLSIGKAGRKRYMGIRPTVRGVTMNPCDHPHGGGEGKTGPGGHPKTPWGKPALGYKTRKKGKASDKLIVRRRKK